MDAMVCVLYVFESGIIAYAVLSGGFTTLENSWYFQRGWDFFR
jgi:hypothetical protein